MSRRPESPYNRIVFTDHRRARDPFIWTTAAQALYQSNITLATSYPKTLRTIGFPTPETVVSDPVVAQSNTILLSFLSKLETFLQTNASALNYTSLWDTTKPFPDLPSLAVLLNRTYPTLISKEQTKNVRDPFYADYAAVHDGRKPFVDPVPLARWAFGDSLPASELEVAVTNKTIFQTWWEMHVLPASTANKSNCLDSIILYTSGVNIVYRNTYLKPTLRLRRLPDIYFRGSSGLRIADWGSPVSEQHYKSYGGTPGERGCDRGEGV